MQAIETPFCVTLEIQFADNTITMNSRYNVGWDEVITVQGRAIN